MYNLVTLQTPLFKNTNKKNPCKTLSCERYTVYLTFNHLFSLFYLLYMLQRQGEEADKETVL